MNYIFGEKALIALRFKVHKFTYELRWYREYFVLMDGMFVFLILGGGCVHTEYEVRILEIDREEIIKKLEKLNAEFQWDCLQKRYVYDFIPRIDNKWIRLRTNGKKSTLTIKNLVTSEIDGTQELEIEVDNFERTNLILKELGYESRGYQENRRCQYLLNGVEVDIDSWPLIPTYLEIEGSSEDAVYNVVEALGFSKDDIITRDVEGIYLDYGHNIKEISDLKLEEERK